MEDQTKLQSQSILKKLYPTKPRLLIPIVRKNKCIEKNRNAVTTQEFNVETTKSEKKPQSLSNDNQRIILYENYYNTRTTLNHPKASIHNTF